jgi:hypothetical protein
MDHRKKVLKLIEAGVFLLVLAACSIPSVIPITAPTSSSAATFTNPSDFQAAISTLGVPTIINFDDMDASPVNNTFIGRSPFDGHTYSRQGITFLNPKGFLLYITPGGLSWNTSNSLSVGQFPYDPNGSKNETDDDLFVTLDPPVVAIGFTLVDYSTYNQDEFVRFVDINGNAVKQLPLPQPSSTSRTFVGIISVDRSITRINIAEDATDDDDVNYDDFIFVP